MSYNQHSFHQMQQSFLRTRENNLRRLSRLEEMIEKVAGLVEKSTSHLIPEDEEEYSYIEKYSATHECKVPQNFVIVCDHQDNVAEYDGPPKFDEDPLEGHDTDPGNNQLLAALTTTPANKENLMVFTGVTQGVEFQLLVDGGSTLNCMSNSLRDKLNLKREECGTVKVLLANGTHMTYCSNVTSYDRYSESSEYVELPRFDAEPEDQVVKPEECEDKTWPIGVLDLEENGRTKDMQKHQESQCQPCEFDMLREIFSCEESQCNADVIAELCMEKKEQPLPTGILGNHDSICVTCPIYGEDLKEAVGPLKTELILNALAAFIPEEHEGLMLEASQVFQKGNEHLNTLVEMDLLRKEEASNLILLNLLSSSCCNLRAIVTVTGGSIYNNLFEFEDIEVLSFQITIFDPGGFKTEHP